MKGISIRGIEERVRSTNHVALTSRVPRTQNDSSVCWILLDLSDTFLKLIHALARVIGITIHILCAEMSPLESVNWS